MDELDKKLGKVIGIETYKRKHYATRKDWMVIETREHGIYMYHKNLDNKVDKHGI